MGIGKRLKEARERAGYTQKELSQKIGVTASAITNYENEISHPKEPVMYALIDALGIEPNYLFQDCVSTIEHTSSISAEAMKLAKDYDTALDDRGRRTIRNVMDFEVGYAAQRPGKRAEKEKAERKSALQNYQEDTSEEIAIYITTLYHQPVSAGNGEVSEYDYSETIQLKQMPPNGTSFIVPVRGDSMEPTYYDGDKVFVRAQIEISPGQIGVFYMDGQMWIKELGDGVLLSHNPKYPPRPMTDDVRCQGLVLGVCDESYLYR